VDVLMSSGQVMMLTPEQVADELQVGRSKVYGMLARGEIPSVKLGRLIRVPRALLEAWIADRLSAEVDSVGGAG
jgi:excisionase family DNA binding protein